MNRRWMGTMVMIGAVAAAVVACSSSEEAAGVTDEESALAVVDAAYEVYNSGDAQGWTEIRDRGSAGLEGEERQEVLDWMVERTLEEFADGARYEQIDCESRGLGEWPVADTGLAAGYYFVCDTLLVSDGGEQAEQFEWVVSEGPDGAVIAVRSDR